jgi:hypothetical protein
MGWKFPVHIHPNFLPKSGISDPFPISRSLCDESSDDLNTLGIAVQY